MKRKIYRISFVFIVLALICSCEFENIMGKNYVDVSVEAGSQSIDDMNANLACVIKNLSDPDDDIANKTFVTPLTNEEKANLNKSDLSALKDKSVTLSEEEKEAVNDTADFVNQYLPKDIDSGYPEIDTLVKSMKESFEKLSEADTVTEGDIIGLKYTMNLLDSVANAIPEGKPIVLSDGSNVTSERLLNTLFQNGSTDKNKEPLTTDQINELLESNKGKKAILDLATSAQDYINVVGEATDFTGGVNVSKLLQSLIDGASSDSTN